MKPANTDWAGLFVWNGDNCQYWLRRLARQILWFKKKSHEGLCSCVLDKRTAHEAPVAQWLLKIASIEWNISEHSNDYLFAWCVKAIHENVPENYFVWLFKNSFSLDWQSIESDLNMEWSTPPCSFSACWWRAPNGRQLGALKNIIYLLDLHIIEHIVL